MFEIDFYSYDHNFCESSIYSLTPHPEYLNAISSLFISFIGLNAFFKSSTDFLLQILYSSLLINGVTSCFYHYYNNIGWGLLDRMSMILIATSSTYTFMYHLDKIIRINRIENTSLMMNTLHVLVTSYFTLLFSIAGLHLETLFNILFGFFLLSLVGYMYLFDKYQNNLKIPKQIISFGWDGIKYIAISGAFWIITENLCSHIIFIKYLFGHVWWHIFVSYGGYLFSLVPNYLTLKDENNIIHINYDFFGLPYLIKY
jgi:hypothetical protein